MKVGKFEVHLINAGYLAMDCGAIFGIIPKTLWQDKVNVDENNRMLMSQNCLLLISDDQKILVDTGVGNGLSDKLRKIYNIQDDTNIVSSLEKYHFTPEDITDVIVTHLHFDHAGGLIDHKTGEAFFSKANYYTSKRQFSWANNPTIIDRASYKIRNYNPLFEDGKLILLKDGEQPFPGMRFYYTSGHTPGLITLEIEDIQTPLFYCTDLFPTHHHIPLHYISAYDLNPLDLLIEKEFFLKKIIKSTGKIIFPHDTNIAMAMVEKINNHYQIYKSYETI